MNIKVAAFTVSEKSSNMLLSFLSEDIPEFQCIGVILYTEYWNIHDFILSNPSSLKGLEYENNMD